MILAAQGERIRQWQCPEKPGPVSLTTADHPPITRIYRCAKQSMHAIGEVVNVKHIKISGQVPPYLSFRLLPLLVISTCGKMDRDAYIKHCQSTGASNSQRITRAEDGGGVESSCKERERDNEQSVGGVVLSEVSDAVLAPETVFTASQKAPRHDLNSPDGDRELGDGDYDVNGRNHPTQQLS